MRVIWEIMVGALMVFMVSFAAILIVGHWIWQRTSNELLKELAAVPQNARRADLEVFDTRQLPVPVRDYLAQALISQHGQVESVRIRHSGTFNIGAIEPRWRSFSSTQHVVIAGPAFLWDGNVRMAPGMPVRVHDAYINGRALLVARLFGLIKAMESRDSPELAEGELIRFLAEAAWYPTVLLASPALTWTPINDVSARLTLLERDLSVSLVVRFGEDGLIESIYSNGRYRDQGGTQVRTPWEGRFWNWKERSGMLIPLDGEVAWLPENGRWPYWRGHIDEITYAFSK